LQEGLTLVRHKASVGIFYIKMTQPNRSESYALVDVYLLAGMRFL
jgi:hypothetical protein